MLIDPSLAGQVHVPTSPKKNGAVGMFPILEIFGVDGIDESMGHFNVEMINVRYQSRRCNSMPFSTFMCELKISSVASLFDLTDFIET